MELSGIRYLEDLDVTDATVFVRVDFNVPLENGVVGDDTRIREALPTISFLREKGARIVLASHLGRPKGKRVAELSMIPVGSRLAELLKAEVIVAEDCVGDEVRHVVRELPPGGICLLENLRFYAAEEAADPAFAAELASLAKFYVNDAFGTAHRAHASTYTMVQHFDDEHRAAGLLIEKELKYMGPLLGAPAKPFVGILGGSKVSDKIGVLENLVGRLDTLLIGGAMAYTFLVAKGVDVGKSRVEHDHIETARQILGAAASRHTNVILPVDHIVADSIDAAKGELVDGQAVAPDRAGFDIGPKTVAKFKAAIAGAATIFWNGPLGVFEKSAFNSGTLAIANAVADAEGTSIIGGGDSVAALQMSGRAGDVSHISTGGGASLEFIEGQDLPGIAALRAGHKFS